MLQKVNIVEKLKKERQKSAMADYILLEVQKILGDQSKQRERIAENIGRTQDNTPDHFHFDLLDTDRLFHVEQIKKICIDYRLRFLDTALFKGDMPEEAISIIARLEKEHSIEIKNLKIIAPSKLFKLEDRDDPLLFAPIGNGYYYLVHRWGNDLHPFRKFLMWPFKSIVNLTLLTVLVSYVLACMVPEGLFSKSALRAEFWILFLFIFKSIAAIVVFYGFALGKNFSPEIWNSRYLN